jgi:hypothetical protein
MSLKLRSQAALSTAVNTFPRLLEGTARTKTGLTDVAHDLLLRWRAQTPPPGYKVADNPSWVHLAGFPDADPNDPNTWRDVSIGVGRVALHDALWEGGKPAIAYMPEGDDQLMFGVNQLRPRAQMLTELHVRGEDQEVYAVRVREGADPTSFAIGYSLNKNFFALPTQQLAPDVVPVNSMLYRV